VVVVVEYGVDLGLVHDGDVDCCFLWSTVWLAWVGFVLFWICVVIIVSATILFVLR
jgi:hypothetical protein